MSLTKVMGCVLLSVALSANEKTAIAHDRLSSELAELLLAISPSQGKKFNGRLPRISSPTMQQISSRPLDGVVASSEGMSTYTPVAAPILVQGGTLKTWSYGSSLVERVQVFLTTEGRPLDADIELWQGPDNTPTKMRVYSEDGKARPFNAVIETPQSPNTVAIRNIGGIEFPLAASLVANDVDEPVSNFPATSTIVQGGALKTFPFPANVQRVELMIKTDGRPLNARIELLQGPNNNKQVIELYADDGLARPFFAIIDTMGSGNVVRVQNTAPIEFPMTASVQPHFVDENLSPFEPIIGGDA
jgi:hypothetical protein